MDFRLCPTRPGALLALAVGALCAFAPSVAEAQAALDDDDDDAAPVPTATSAPEEETLIGLGLRLRNVRLPESVLEIFVEDAPGGSSSFGIGGEISRRKGDFELVFGLEYEKISVVDGIWVERDKEPPGDEVDFVEFDGFGWITADVTFLNHTRFGQHFALRYGGGAGLGVLLGEVKRTDYRCTSSALDSCGPYIGAENDQTPYDLPPVFPVLTGIFGAQIRPLPSMFINIELGIRTLPFFGITGGGYF
jgi:hypothetical protein